LLQQLEPLAITSSTVAALQAALDEKTSQAAEAERLKQEIATYTAGLASAADLQSRRDNLLQQLKDLDSIPAFADAAERVLQAASELRSLQACTEECNSLQKQLVDLTATLGPLEIKQMEVEAAQKQLRHLLANVRTDVHSQPDQQQEEPDLVELDQQLAALMAVQQQLLKLQEQDQPASASQLLAGKQQLLADLQEQQLQLQSCEHQLEGLQHVPAELTATAAKVQELQSLDLQLTQLHSAHGSMELLQRRLSDERAQLQDLAAAADEVQRLEQQVAELREVDERRAVLREELKELDACNAELGQLQHRLSAMQEAAQQHSQLVAELKRLKENAAAIPALEQQVGELKLADAVQDLKRQLANARQDIADLLEAKMKSELADQETDIQMTTVTKTVTFLRNELEAAHSQMMLLADKYKRQKGKCFLLKHGATKWLRPALLDAAQQR
jgi:DNA repair exonuclease SbcCD ATPase subunit